MCSLLALTLLVAWIVTNDKYTTFASDNFTLITHLLDRRTYLHIKLPFGSLTVIYLSPSRRRLLLQDGLIGLNEKTALIEYVVSVSRLLIAISNTASS